VRSGAGSIHTSWATDVAREEFEAERRLSTILRTDASICKFR
jgi:hypothetical protein